jgi:Phytanoyl-CoA dioxygenase (PhyH)
MNFLHESLPISPEAPFVDAPTNDTSVSSDRFFFEQNGYLRARALADSAEITDIRNTILQLMAKAAGREEGIFFDFAGADDGTEQMRLPQMLDVRNFAPHLVEGQFFRNAEALARSLLGPDATFKADHPIFKPAHHGATTPWHQDDAFRQPEFEHNEISIWLALQDTDAENGCLTFVPGSHKWPVLPHRWVGDDQRIHALECYEGWTPDQEVLCPLRAGDASVHTNRTLHGAGANHSSRDRLAYVLVFGTPPKRLANAGEYPWLLNKVEPRLERRKAWMKRGGFVVHGWRRFRQIRQVGVRETARRIRQKLGF